MSVDAFESLFVDEAKIDEELLVVILRRYVKLTREGNILPLADFGTLNSEKKLTIILLARKVLAAKNIATDILGPSDVQNISGLPSGTVNPTLRGLADKGILKNENGKYSIPNYAIFKIKNMFGI